MIPLVGIPYIASFDLLDKAIRSLPADRVERIHIIDNSSLWEAIEYPLDPRVHITRMHHNVGVAQAWNIIIKANPGMRWWFIINSDVAFSADDLDRIERAMKVHDVVTFSGMHAFGIRASAIERVGWFDENLHPAYFEDNDWHRRAELLGVHIEQIAPQEYHYGSATIKSSEVFRKKNDRTFTMNRGYYVAKWGGSVGNETYTTPFNRGGSPREWTLDISRLANQSWKE